MSHAIENLNGVDLMAYAGDVPWHGLGKRVSNDLTPHQMLDEAGLNWRVHKIKNHHYWQGKERESGTSILIRDLDGKKLTDISDNWEPVQNEDAFDFFTEFVKAGDMEMHTAGSLDGGCIVWALAKVKESFEVFDGDQVDAFLHFTNFHRYGFSTDVRFTPIRVVCKNTLSLSLSSKLERMAKFNHCRQFKPELAKEILGISKVKMKNYKEMATYLGNHRAKNEDIVQYFMRIFPITAAKTDESRSKELSRNAKLALDVLETQPGAKYAEGSWWPVFNSVSYVTGHLVGRSVDTRIKSDWYGTNKNVKLKALELAVDMAKKSPEMAI